ncbi:MAG TPA: hypothetical protein VD865_09305 [Stenotrophomonas sp.]|nr:hypothetical protein [Stenotrophomonas sp.]
MPAGLETIGLLPPPDPQRWETSPLSRLALGARRGMVGLRLAAQVAAELREQGVRQWHGRGDATGSHGCWHWWPMPGGAFWGCTDDRRLGLLLDARREAAWLFWQERGGCGDR